MSYAIEEVATKRTIKDSEGLNHEYQHRETAEKVMERLVVIEGAWKKEELRVVPR